jgi:hypothetical protein
MNSTTTNVKGIEIKTPNMKDIEAAIVAAVQKETGAVIEWTFRGDGFTVNGSPEAVKAALPWFAKSKIESQHHDDELNETFVYFAC